MNDKAYVNTLVAAVRHDLSKGLKRDEVLRSLSHVISKDLFNKVKDQV